jgi:ribonuclease BN (tRNA processing enzyme)
MEEEEQLFTLLEQMNGASFPVNARDLPSDVHYEFNNVNSIIEDNKAVIERKELNHPGGGSAYKITEQGMSCAYITDNELFPPAVTATSYEDWILFCHGVDVLIHDAQYDTNDMPHKHGWGHSTMPQVRQLALDAEVRSLVMFHHDPDRTDLHLDFVQKDNDQYFHGKRAPALSVCAAEGMQIRLAARSGARSAVIEVL